MPDFIRGFDNQNQPIIPGETGLLPLTYFNLIHLKHGENIKQQVTGFETVCVVLRSLESSY